MGNALISELGDMKAVNHQESGTDLVSMLTGRDGGGIRGPFHTGEREGRKDMQQPGARESSRT